MIGLRETLEAATPGPWRMDDGFGSKIAVYGRVVDGVARTLVTEIDTSYDAPFDRAECENDARLIALAPELAAEVLELRERHREAMALVLDMGEALTTLNTMAAHSDAATGFLIESGIELNALLARLDQLGKEQPDG